MQISRFLLPFALLLPLGCDCDPPEAEFSIEETLTDDEWASLEDAWGAADTEPSYCRYACMRVYERLSGWTVVRTDSCVLEVDIEDPDTGSDPESVDVESAVVICEGAAVAYECEE